MKVIIIVLNLEIGYFFKEETISKRICYIIQKKTRNCDEISGNKYINLFNCK
jgi:hypothetical protein